MKCRGIKSASRRRGATLAMSVVMMVALVGFAALSIDVGYLYTVKGEAQNLTDSAARAGASAFIGQVSTGDPEQEQSSTETLTEANSRAVQYASQNSVHGITPSLESKDVVVGRYDFDNPTAPLSPTGLANAVQVTARLTSDSPNGAVPNLFAPVLGFGNSDVSATAIAAFDDRFAGYTPDPGVLIPFTIEINEYETQLTGGPDEFSYDADLDLIQSFADGTLEVDIYPYRNASGNFGLLNVGKTNQGVPGLEYQILNGITSAELEDETGSPELVFLDDQGQSQTYQISGNPGMKSALKSPIEARLGDVVGFFIYTAVSGNGANVMYTIVDVRFGRLMDVKLTGNPNNRRVVIQPTPYTGPGVRTGSGAPSTNGYVGRVLLV
ncbi:MAG: hypothetical protein GY778_30620 [bacterium]|nr:hypothetical protein [bacterium]